MKLLKRMKQIIAMCLTLALSIMLVPPSTAKATNENEWTTITIQANTPPDFEQEIGVDLVSETGITFTAFLNKDNEYTTDLTVPSYRTFTTKVSFPSGEKYATNIAKKYKIKNEIAVEIVFDVFPYASNSKVEDNTYQVKNSNKITESNHSEETNVEVQTQTNDTQNKNNKLAKPEEVIKQFEERVAFMENNPNFKEFLDRYASFEAYYLQASPDNTKEKWQQMSDLEKYTYYITVIKPTTIIMGNEYADFEDVEAELWAHKKILEEIEDGDKVYDAVIDVWKWQHAYWIENMYTYDFFEEEKNKNNSSESEDDTVELTEKDQKEIDEANKELEKELKKDVKEENIVVTILKENWITFTLLAVVGIGFLVIHFINKKKNITDVEED